MDSFNRITQLTQFKKKADRAFIHRMPMANMTLVFVTTRQVMRGFGTGEMNLFGIASYCDSSTDMDAVRSLAVAWIIATIPGIRHIDGAWIAEQSVEVEKR